MVANANPRGPTRPDGGPKGPEEGKPWTPSTFGSTGVSPPSQQRLASGFSSRGSTALMVFPTPLNSSVLEIKSLSEDQTVKVIVFGYFDYNIACRNTVDQSQREM